MTPVKTPVVGGPWPFKKKMLDYCAKNPRLVLTEIQDFTFECHRHFEILRMFDEGQKSFQDTLYYRYQIDTARKTPPDALKKIEEFKVLYARIKKEGCQVAPIVTDNGCRLDGSHRLAILLHLGIRETQINVGHLEDVYSKDECEKFHQFVSEYRRDTYGLS